MFPGEFPRQGVQLTHALDRHQECLVRGQACGHQTGDEFPQVVFQFLDIHGVDGLTPAQVFPPLVDACFQGGARL